MIDDTDNMHASESFSESELFLRKREGYAWSSPAGGALGLGPTIPPIAPDLGALDFLVAPRGFELLSAEPFGVSWLAGTGDFLASSGGLVAGTRGARGAGGNRGCVAAQGLQQGK